MVRERRTATVRGGRIELTKQEFDLLYLMASRPGAVFTRAALLQEVWSDAGGYAATFRIAMRPGERRRGRQTA